MHAETPDTEELIERAGGATTRPASGCWPGTAPGCGGWSPSASTAAGRPRRPLRRRPGGPGRGRPHPGRLPARPAAAVLPLAAAARLGAAGRAAPPPRRRRTSGASPRGGRRPRLPDRVGPGAGRPAAGQRDEPQPAPAPRGAARPGPGRPGAAGRARPRGAGRCGTWSSSRRPRRRPSWASARGPSSPGCMRALERLRDLLDDEPRGGPAMTDRSDRPTAARRRDRPGPGRAGRRADRAAPGRRAGRPGGADPRSTRSTPSELRRLLPALEVLADLGELGRRRPLAGRRRAPRPGRSRPGRWATSGSSARSAGAAWGSSTRPSSSRSAAGWP